MRSEKVNVTPKYIKEKTEEKKASFPILSSRDTIAQKDGEKFKRDSTQLCKTCYYFDSHKISLRAFFHQECGLCGQDQRYSSSLTDALCKSCATENDLCKHCGGEKEF